jgi:DNA-binding NtrC family response regulator
MGRSGARRQALIVEDDPGVRDLAAAILEETDLGVVETETAEEAIDHLSRSGEEVAMAFVDVRLPGRVDGVELARVIADRWPHVRVLVTSGEGSRSRALPQGATFMPKPWRALDILRHAERAARARPV